MVVGKIASQAGHAFLGAYLLCKDSERLSTYHSRFPSSPGTKVVLRARNLSALERVQEQAENAGLTTFLVVDSGCPNFHGGQPIVTALGLGPARRDEIHTITKRLQLLNTL